MLPTIRAEDPFVSALKDGAVFRATCDLAQIIVMEMDTACMENVTVTAITVGEAVRSSHALFNAVTEVFVKMHRLRRGVCAKRVLQALDASTQHAPAKRPKRALVTDTAFADVRRRCLAMEIARANVAGKELGAMHHFAQNIVISEESVSLVSVYVKRDGLGTRVNEWNVKIFAQVMEIV